VSVRPRRLAALLAVAAAAMVLPPSSADTIQQIEQPTKVPALEGFLSLGNGIEPGSAGTYGFALRNRYNTSLENVTLTVELYRWATAEAARPIEEIQAPPIFEQTGSLNQTFALASLAPNATFPVRVSVRAGISTPEGVYFTRHLLQFDYANVTDPGDPAPRAEHFLMKSRGYFTAQEFESINYSDLEFSLDALGVAGIVPDSSFSVRKPAPLWPLALVVGATAATGTLALLSYLADAYPEKYPRVKQQLLRWSGKLWVWRALITQSIRMRFGR
jgi:hypothetical protein